MNLNLNDKRALITGSTAGIGRAIAEKLAAEGASVLINGRKKSDVDSAVTEISKAFPDNRIEGVAADFSRKEEIDALIREIQDVDILINNVGIFNSIPFEEITDDEWYEMFTINVMSGVRLARNYFPKMIERNEGRIIFISSESGLNIPPEMIHYGMSKTAQLSISRGLARLTKGTNVTVNSILPGPTLSRTNESTLKKEAEKSGITMEAAGLKFIQDKRPTSLIQRFAENEEVANMVAYIASPLSSATNGAALRVDGGVVNSII